MPHDVSLIAMLAAGFGLALLLGLMAVQLRMPPLVGYLLAGVLIGPATPGFVADLNLAGQLAEVGVMLLMFGVGLHFSFNDLVAVKRIAVPGALVQMAVATALGLLAALAWGWPWQGALVFGLCLSVASTVVLLRALEARGLLKSINGQIAVGWLVVEDLLMVLILVLLPVLFPVAGVQADGADGLAGLVAVASTVAKVLAFALLMWLLGRRVLPKILWWVARTGSQELFTLAVVAAAVGVAFGAAKWFGVSFALGAFFAGMVMRESEFSHRAAAESLPLRDAFAVLFFVSVGMLFDPSVLWTEPTKLLTTVAIVMLGKTLAAIALALVFRYPLNTALTVGVSLAQIGEFSFILAGLGVALGVLPREGQSLVLAAAVVSIAANSALFALLQPARAWLLARSALARKLEHGNDPLAQLPDNTQPSLLSKQVVLVGHGSVGQAVVQALQAKGMAVVVVDHKRSTVDALRQEGVAAVLGDAAQPEVLVQAHIARAAVLVLSLRNPVAIQNTLHTAAVLNPTLRVLLLAYSAQEKELLQQHTQTHGHVHVLYAPQALADAVVALL